MVDIVRPKLGSRCHFWQTVKIFATYEGVSAQPIDNRPEPMLSPLNYPDKFAPLFEIGLTDLPKSGSQMNLVKSANEKL